MCNYLEFNTYRVKNNIKHTHSGRRTHKTQHLCIFHGENTAVKLRLKRNRRLQWQSLQGNQYRNKSLTCAKSNQGIGLQKGGDQVLGIYWENFVSLWPHNVICPQQERTEREMIIRGVNKNNTKRTFIWRRTVWYFQGWNYFKGCC